MCAAAGAAVSEKLVHVTHGLDTGATSGAERAGCLATLGGIHMRLLCAARRPERPFTAGKLAKCADRSE